MFCDKSFSGWSTYRAAAQILGRPILGKLNAGIHPSIVNNKQDDDRRGAFKTAQKTIIGSIVREKEQCMKWKKWKQEVMDVVIRWTS